MALMISLWGFLPLLRCSSVFLNIASLVEAFWVLDPVFNLYFFMCSFSNLLYLPFLEVLVVMGIEGGVFSCM